MGVGLHLRQYLLCSFAIHCISRCYTIWVHCVIIRAKQALPKANVDIHIQEWLFLFYIDMWVFYCIFYVSPLVVLNATRPPHGTAVRDFFMKKITFLIDGFNVYHSILQLREDTFQSHGLGLNLKWLDLYSLCSSYVPTYGKEYKLESVYYFTALAEHFRNRNPKKIERHKAYIKCLETTGIIVEYGRFKRTRGRYEEKQTDVAIGVRLLEILCTDKCDMAVIVSGDTDLIPAVKTCNRLFQNKKVIFGFPYARHNLDLATLCPNSFKIKQKSYKKHQFPNPTILEDGKKVYKPLRWYNSDVINAFFSPS